MPRLNIGDLVKNDKDTIVKVMKVIDYTTSKREMAKAITYCHDWGEYVLYTRAVSRLENLGFTPLHLEFYLPESWRQRDDVVALGKKITKEMRRLDNANYPWKEEVGKVASNSVMEREEGERLAGAGAR